MQRLVDIILAATNANGIDLLFPFSLMFLILTSQGYGPNTSTSTYPKLNYLGTRTHIASNSIHPLPNPPLVGEQVGVDHPRFKLIHQHPRLFKCREKGGDPETQGWQWIRFSQVGLRFRTRVKSDTILIGKNPNVQPTHCCLPLGLSMGWDGPGLGLSNPISNIGRACRD